MVVPGQQSVRQPLLSMPAYQPASTLSDTTRRLCCAPYLDVAFGDAVIREVVESERKAVPPSYGFDLDPVVRHCLRARRLIIARYAVVTALLLAGLCLNAASTLLWLVFCVAVVWFRSPSMRELPRSFRLAIGAAVASVVLCFVGYAVANVFISSFLSFAGLGDLGGLGSSFDRGSSTSGLGDLFSVGAINLRLLSPLLLGGAMFVALFLFRRHTYGIITTELAPGAPSSAPRTGNPRVERRLAAVAAMQRGNIGVHDVDPYAGAGWIEHNWSIAVTLRPADQYDRGPGQGRSDRLRLDSAVLNRRVGDAVVALRDARLGDGERIPNVYVVPYVAADGNRRSDDPLIDPRTRTPRTMASLETLAAIEACPQGGLRHYLRAVVPASGKEIRTPYGELVLPAQDSGIGVTAFVHLAVEGGMLYAEFVATVMPQVRSLYHLGDNLRPERVQARAALHTLREFLHDNLLGPVHLVRTGWNSLRLQSRMARSAQAADEFRSYDYGARFSVRELAAERPTVKFMQLLDATKYIKLLDQAVTESIVDFLDENGIDTTAFKNAVANVTNNYNMTQDFGHKIYGGIQNFGGKNANVQNNMAGGTHPAPAARRTGGGTRG
jgi:hypothetical protein